MEEPPDINTLVSRVAESGDEEALRTLASLAKDTSQSYAAEAITEFVRIVEEMDLSNQPLVQAISSSLHEIAEDGEHALRNFARLTLSGSTLVLSAYWADVQLTREMARDKQMFVQVMHNLSVELGTPLPDLDKNYDILRREFLDEIKAEELPVRVHVPHPYAGTAQYSGKLPLSPRQELSLDPSQYKTIETLEAIHLSSFSHRYQKRTRQPYERLSGAEKEEHIQRLKDIFDRTGIYPELDTEKLHALNPIKMAVVSRVAEVFDKNIFQNNNIRLGGLTTNHPLYKNSAMFFNLYDFDISRALFLMKDVPGELKEETKTNFVNTVLDHFPSGIAKKAQTFLLEHGFFDEISRQGPTYSLSTPRNPGISNRSVYRLTTADTDPEADYVFPLTPQQRTIVELHHEFAHSLTMASTLANVILSGLPMYSESISDVFAELSTGTSLKRNYTRGLSALMGDFVHYTVPALNAITDEDREDAKSMSITERHERAMEITQRATISLEELRQLELIVAETKGFYNGDLGQFTSVIQEHKRKNLTPVQSELIEAALSDIELLEELQSSSQKPNYFDDVLTAMQMSNSIVGSVETLHFEYRSAIMQLEHVSELNSTELDLLEAGEQLNPETSSALDRKAGALAQNINNVVGLSQALETAIKKEIVRWNDLHPPSASEIQER